MTTDTPALERPAAWRSRARRLVSPRGALVLLLFLVGALAFLPAIRSPLFLDDYLQLSMIDGTYPSARSPLNLYDFVSDADRPLLIARGVLPWWTHPEFSVRFLRPLSSALLWLDHEVLGHAPLLPHLHSLLWWASAVLAALAIFRRAFSARVAALAATIFALAPCHAVPLAWLANREALVALALGTLALGAYVRWREARRARDAALATAAFALAMLAGEYALCFGGYVVAIEVVRRERIVRRATGILPFVLPAASYLVARAALRYGTTGSGLYRDPLADPISFLRTAPRRLVTLLADGWLTADGDAWGGTMPWWAMALLVVAAVAALFVPLRRAFAQLDDAPRATATWMLVGSIASLTPVLAVAPSPRVIGISVLGVAGVVAILLDHAWFPREAAAGRRRSRAAELTGLVALALGFAHLVHAPVTAWLAARGIAQAAAGFAERAAWMRGRIQDPERAHVVLIRAAWHTTFFGPFAIEPLHGTPPARWRVLTQAPGHVLLLRRDDRTIEVVAPKDSSLFPWGPDDLFRSDDAPVRAGDEFQVPGMQATVLEADERGPHRVRFTFDRDLEDAPFAWIVEDRGALRDAPLPRPGFGAPLDP